MYNKSLTLKELQKFSSKMPPRFIGEQHLQYKFDLAKKNPSPFLISYLQNHKNKNIKRFLESYKKVKQCDDRWPECHSLEDWDNLSEEIKARCYEEHAFSPYHFKKDSGDENFFNPTVESLRIIDPNLELFDKTGYMIHNLAGCKNVIYENKHLFKNANIVEFACGDGILSAFALYMGAKKSTLTEFSDYNIKIGKKIKELMQFSDETFNICKSDIKNLDDTKKFCRGKDVVLISGILTLLDTQHDVLESIAEEKPKYIIISERYYACENIAKNTATRIKYNKEEIKNIAESSIPTICPVDINAVDFNNPLHSPSDPKNFENIDEYPIIRLYIPNISWYDFILEKFGYSKIKFHCWSADFSIDTNEKFTAVYKLDNDKTNK